MVKNRDRWEVTAVHRDGGLSVKGRTGAVLLPAAYVAEHLELAYAQTSHATQGRTVDRSLLLLDGPADTRSVYVPMTRGRHSNEAFVVLEGEETARDVLAQALSRSWIDQPAVARRAELEHRQDPGEGREAEATLSRERLRELMARQHEIGSALSLAETRARLYGEQLDRAVSRRDDLVEKLSHAETRLEHARDVLDELDRPLVRRVHRAEISHALGGRNQAEGTIRGAGRELAELDEQIPQLQASVAQAEAMLARRPALDRERHGIRRELDRDLSARARSLGADPPEHVADRIGPRPPGAAVADLWDEAAARLDQHATAFPVDPEYRHLGLSRSWDDSPAATSRRAAERACERLDNSLGRGRSIEPPGLELGISR